MPPGTSSFKLDPTSEILNKFNDLYIYKFNNDIKLLLQKYNKQLIRFESSWSSSLLVRSTHLGSNLLYGVLGEVHFIFKNFTMLANWNMSHNNRTSL